MYNVLDMTEPKETLASDPVTQSCPQFTGEGISPGRGEAVVSGCTASWSRARIWSQASRTPLPERFLLCGDFQVILRTPSS